MTLKRQKQLALPSYYEPVTLVYSHIKEPTLKYEVARRQTKRDLNEKWWYIRAKLRVLCRTEK